MKFRVVLQQDEDGVFVVEVPSLPGCVSQGISRAQALDNIREAIEGYLESLKHHGEPIPPPIDEEIVDVSKHGAASVRPRGRPCPSEGRLRIQPATCSHIITRHHDPPHRRLVVPDHSEIAKGTLRSIIRQAGLTVEQFAALL
jgi:predicted RNase H-like HicB family nuclease